MDSNSGVLEVNMKRLTLLLLLLVSTSVFAKWTEVGGNAAAGQTAYVDVGTIKIKGHKVKMWSLYDYKTVKESEDKKYLSSMAREEYDCEEETTRLLDLYLYSENMRQGEIVSSYTSAKDEATSITPESMGETVFKRACGKK